MLHVVIKTIETISECAENLQPRVETIPVVPEVGKIRTAHACRTPTSREAAESVSTLSHW